MLTLTHAFGAVSQDTRRRLFGEGGEQGRLQAPVEDGWQVPIKVRSQAQG
jgi:hypothetical protein